MKRFLLLYTGPPTAGRLARRLAGVVGADRRALFWRLTASERHSATVIDGVLSQAVTEVSEMHEGDIVVHGSARVVQGLLERDLVDSCG